MLCGEESIALWRGKHCFAERKAPFCGEESDVLQGGEPYPRRCAVGRRQRIYLHKDVVVGSGKMAA